MSLGRVRYRHILVVTVTAFLAACSRQLAQPPLPPQDLAIFSAAPDAALVDYLRAENSFTDAAFSRFMRLEKELTQEILEGNSEERVSSPLVLPPFEYFSVEQQTLRHPLIYRQHINKKNLVLVFDPNIVFASYPQAGIGMLRISPRHTSIAFTADLKHSGAFSLFIWDIGKERITEVDSGDVQDAEWGADDCALFFTRRERGLARRLSSWRCDDPQKTALLYEEKDRSRALTLRRAKDGSELLVSADSQVNSRVFSLPLASKLPKLRELRPFRTREKFSVWPHPATYLIRKADGSLWRLDRAEGASARNIPLPAATLIEDADVFREAVLLFERREARPYLQVYDPVGGSLADIALPPNTDSVGRLPAPNFDSLIARVGLDSLVTPRSVAEVDLQQRSLRITQPGSYPPPYVAEDFEIQRLAISASDGAVIPVTVAALRKTQGPAPLLLMGYGAYAKISSESFSAARFSLLRRGFRLAVAHVRGDGILGQDWYDAGRRLNKKQSFEDFHACARYFLDQGYATPGKLFAYGKSAGGLLVAVAAGRDPELFKAIVLDRPFVDVIAGLTSGSDVGVREYEEWGNPENPAERAYIESYSPAQQIAAYQYPSMLVFSGLRDEAVPYWDVARWFALLRAKDKVLAEDAISEKYLWMSASAAHVQEVDTYAEARLQARINAFLLLKAEAD